MANRRKERFLTPKTKTKKQDRIATFDFESNNWIEHEMGGFYDGKDYFMFHSVADLLDHVLVKKYRGVIIYGHYAGKFDTLFVLNEIAKVDSGYHIDMINQGAKITQLKLTKDGHNWYFRDSSSLFPHTKLASLAKTFDTTVKKREGAINFEAGERVDKRIALHRDYLKDDCVSLYQVIDGFRSMPVVKEEGLNLTLASQAMGMWRHTLKQPVKVCSQKIADFCRNGYYGGRVEIFKMSGENLNYYDVNSLYPHAMISQPTPTEFKDIIYDLNDDLSFCDVTIMAPEMHIPILPFRGDEDKLYFPYGTFRGTFYSEEIKLALSQGYRIEKFHKGYSFHKSHDFFNEYILKFYEMKNNSPKGSAQYFIAKLLMNALYGKFGQKETRQKIKTFEGEDSYKYLHNEEIFDKTGLVVCEEKYRAPYMLPHIAGAITANSRIHMCKKLLIPHEDSAYYMDTDSFLTQHKIETSDLLGELKLEYESGISGLFLKAKGYDLSKNGETLDRKMKGFSKDFLKKMTREEFAAQKFEYKKSTMATMKTSLIRNGNFLSMVDITKTIQSPYSKRRVFPNGNTTPWEVKNGLIQLT